MKSSYGTYTRWPFFVEYPLTIQFFLSSDQWWEFKFIPGETIR